MIVAAAIAGALFLLFLAIRIPGRHQPLERPWWFD